MEHALLLKCQSNAVAGVFHVLAFYFQFFFQQLHKRGGVSRKRQGLPFQVHQNPGQLRIFSGGMLPAGPLDAPQSCVLEDSQLPPCIPCSRALCKGALSPNGQVCQPCRGTRHTPCSRGGCRLSALAIFPRPLSLGAESNSG
jgi:hypothetical protein